MPGEAADEQSTPNGRTVAVSGGTGFVGQSVVEQLISEGFRVALVTRRDVGATTHASVAQILDDGSLDGLATALGALEVEAVIHLATHFVAHHEPADVSPLLAANLTFATRLVDAASIAGAERFVNASTSWQHVGGEGYRPASLYAATKQAFEDILVHYHRNAGVDVRNLTLFDTYGAGDTRKKLIPLLLDHERSGATLEMSSGNQLIDLLHVSDVARGFVRAATDEAVAGNWTLTSGDPISVRNLVETFQSARNSRVDVRFGARPDRPNEMRQSWLVDPELAGWKPSMPLRSGLVDL